MEKVRQKWAAFTEKHQGLAQFLIFFVISNGVTLLQMLMMPALKGCFEHTALIGINFQILPIGAQGNGEGYYVFNYAAGRIVDGGGGGMAYFLAVEISLLAAQVLNFFLQRKVTFKSNKSVATAATWYFIAWIVISVGAAALQGIYKEPIYTFLIKGMGAGLGTTIADVITMLINSLVSFWVFYPIMKIIFKE